jgi:hypothetical protein
VADSYRLQVLKALTLLLEGTVVTPVAGITPALPATLDGCVFRGRSVFSDSDPKTMLSILESPRPGGAQYAGEGEARNEDWLLLIQGFCPDDKENPSDPVYSILEDVEQRLSRINAIASDGTGKPAFPAHYMLGGLITRFQASPGVVRPPTENVSSKSFFYLPVQVGLARIFT